jgi:2-oxoglutarate dehydrogenase E1 component
MYEQFKADPDSVGESWKEFFADYRSVTESIAAHVAPPHDRPADEQRRPYDAVPPNTVPAAPVLATPPAGPAVAAEAPAPAPATPTPTPTPQEDVPADEPGTLIRGAGAVIAVNMERSLTVPTATSFCNVPARLLEVNR